MVPLKMIVDLSSQARRLSLTFIRPDQLSPRTMDQLGEVCESTRHWWIPLTKAHDRRFDVLFDVRLN